jgi:CubicO group peptidase (beta-lactamase class C family)
VQKRNVKRIIAIVLVFTSFITTTTFKAKGFNINLLDEGFQISEPKEQQMNGQLLLDMIDEIEKQNYPIHGYVLFRNGYMVSEKYFNPIYDKDTTHILYSCTKSVISALIGIAIDNGFIEGINKTILSYFTDFELQNYDVRKENITIENLLTMSTGLEWNELTVSYLNPENSYRRLTGSENWVEFVLNQPMSNSPGSIFNYNSGASHLLSAILQKSTGMTTLEFATQYLFKPLGITNVQWNEDPQGINFGGSLLYMTPRDMGKFGNLFLNNGSWDGTQILSPHWVRNSTSAQISMNHYNDYGYQWWIDKSSSMYAAVGWSGQRIYVFPDYDIVVVFTADFGETDHPYSQLINEYVLPSIGYIEQTDETKSSSEETPATSAIHIIYVFSTLVLLRRKKVEN